MRKEVNSMQVIPAWCARTVSLIVICAATVGGWGPVARSEAKGTTPNLGGIWALEGTGPAGLVNLGGRIGTLRLRQHGHTLTFTLTSGRHHYPGTGVAAWPPPRLALTWRMPTVGIVRFAGGVQAGGRVLGQWSDGHGDDGGALLVRVGR
jgi:hypothetical protein